MTKVLEFNPDKKDDYLDLKNRYTFQGIAEIDKEFNNSLCITIQEFLFSLYGINQNILEPFTRTFISNRNLRQREIKELYGFTTLTELLTNLKKYDISSSKDIRAVALGIARASKFIIFEPEIKNMIDGFFKQLLRYSDVILDTAVFIYNREVQREKECMQRILNYRLDNLAEILFVLGIINDDQACTYIINRNTDVFLRCVNLCDKIKNYHVFRWLGVKYDSISDKSGIDSDVKRLLTVFKRMLIKPLTETGLKTLAAYGVNGTEAVLVSYYIAKIRYESERFIQREMMYVDNNWETIMLHAAAASLTEEKYHEHFIDIMNSKSINNGDFLLTDIITKIMTYKYPLKDMVKSYLLIKEYTKKPVTMYPMFKFNVLLNREIMQYLTREEKLISCLQSYNDENKDKDRISKLNIYMTDNFTLLEVMEAAYSNFKDVISELINGNYVSLEEILKFSDSEDTLKYLVNIIKTCASLTSDKLMLALMNKYSVSEFQFKFNKNLYDMIDEKRFLRMFKCGSELYKNEEQLYSSICYVLELYLYNRMGRFDEFCCKLIINIPSTRDDIRFVEMRELVLNSKDVDKDLLHKVQKILLSDEDYNSLMKENREAEEYNEELETWCAETQLWLDSAEGLEEIAEMLNELEDNNEYTEEQLEAFAQLSYNHCVDKGEFNVLLSNSDYDAAEKLLTFVEAYGVEIEEDIKIIMGVQYNAD